MSPANQLNGFDLTSHTIAELENSDQVIKFFAMFGYDLNDAVIRLWSALNLDVFSV